MSSRRLGVSGAMALLLILSTAAPALASDLAGYLEEADEAVYSGRKIVITVWDGDSMYALLDIEHAAGMTVVDRHGTDVMVGRGKLRPLATADGAIQFTEWTEPVARGKYRAVEAGYRDHGGRPAEVIEIMEGELLRARIMFDDDTYAPVVTQVFDGTGRLFRYSSMVEFAPNTVDLPNPQQIEEIPYEVAVPAEAVALRPTVGGYDLVDVYVGPEDVSQGFYTDGLFSFSLFALAGRADVGTMADTVIHRSRGSEYRLVPAATEVWTLWNAPGETFVLVGDLPPDHLDDVLADLPRPERRNWFQRAWHALFG